MLWTHSYDCCVLEHDTKTKVRRVYARCTIMLCSVSMTKDVAQWVNVLKLKEAVGAKKLI